MSSPAPKRKAEAEAQPPRDARPAFAEAVEAQAQAQAQQAVLPAARAGQRDLGRGAKPQPLSDPSWWLDADNTESLEEFRARMAAAEAARQAKLARLVSAHEAGELLPLPDLCAALKDTRAVVLLQARTDESRRLAAALLAPLATPAFQAFIATGGVAPEDSGDDEAMDDDAPAVQQWTYLWTLNLALLELEKRWGHNTYGIGYNVLSEECVRSHLPVLALMFRNGAHDTLLFSVAAYGIKSWRDVARHDFDCPVVEGQSRADLEAARKAAVTAFTLRVIAASGAALVAALPHAERFKAFPESTLRDFVCAWVRVGDSADDIGVCCAALRDACGVDALVRLITALATNEAFPEHSHGAAIDVVCALVKHDDDVRAAALGAGLGRALARSVHRNPEALRGMIKTCVPAAQAAFDAGAAAQLVAVLDAQNPYTVRAVKTAAKAGYAGHLIDAGVLPQLVAYFAAQEDDEDRLSYFDCAVRALYALLSWSDNEDDEEGPLAKLAVDAHILVTPGALAALLRLAALPPSPRYIRGRMKLPPSPSFADWLLGELLHVAPVAVLQAAVLDGAVPLRHLPRLMAHCKARKHADTMLRMCRDTPAVLTLLRAPPPARAVPAALAVLALAETEAVLTAQQQADNDAALEPFFLRLLAEGDRVAMCVQSGLAAFVTAGPGEPQFWDGDESARKWRGRLADCDARADYGVLCRLLQLADPVILPTSAHVARLVARAVERVVARGDAGAGLSLAAAAAEALADGTDTTGIMRLARTSAPRTLTRTLRAGLDATAGRGALVTAACVRMLLRRMAAGESVKPALYDCCYFGWDDSHAAVLWPSRCTVCRSACPACASDAATEQDEEKPVALSNKERIAFEAELVAAFQARLAERLSWERPAQAGQARV